MTAIVTKLGISLPYLGHRWYGEPPDEVRDEFFHQARLMDLDALTSPQASEKLTPRLWRRYGARAFAMLDEIRADRRMAAVLIEGAEYLRCEIEHLARREMVERLEDFLRRRSKIAQVMRESEIRAAPGLREACAILFGDLAEQKIDEYFAGRQRARGA